MGMNQEYWRNRIMYRSDLSSRVTHLTKRSEGKRAIENLFNILDTKEIRGSGKDGFIIGDSKAACFLDVPLQSLAEIVRYEDEQLKVDSDYKPRYEGFGLRFNKGTLFNKSGRPVIYGDTDELKRLLPKTEYWRMVKLDYSDPESIIDWTHEREWRIKGSLKFEYNEIEIIVGCGARYQEFVKYYQEKNPRLLEEIQGIIVLDSILK